MALHCWKKVQNNIYFYSQCPSVTDFGTHPNPDNAIVIKNVRPKTWSGRKFDIGVYKNGKLLVVQKEVHIGDQVDFLLQPRIFFGVVRNMHVGSVFTSLEITSSLAEFDLSNYPYGIVVTLTEAGGSGEYKFTGEHAA